ncbi:hypothetical protein BH24BAC1_BH24BAC1_07560 [soil metagenome]
MALNDKDLKVEIPFTIGDMVAVYHSLKQYREWTQAEIATTEKWVPSEEGEACSTLDLQVMRTDRLLALEENLDSTERALAKVMAYMRYPL